MPKGVNSTRCLNATRFLRKQLMNLTVRLRGKGCLKRLNADHAHDTAARQEANRLGRHVDRDKLSVILKRWRLSKKHMGCKPKGYTIRDAAEYIGVPKERYRSWERDIRGTPELSDLLKLEKLGIISIRWKL